MRSFPPWPSLTFSESLLTAPPGRTVGVQTYIDTRKDYMLVFWLARIAGNKKAGFEARAERLDQFRREHVH